MALRRHVSLGLLLRLEIVQQNRTFLAFLTPIADHDAGAIDDFSGVAFAVEDTCDDEAWKISLVRDVIILNSSIPIEPKTRSRKKPQKSQPENKKETKKE